MILRDSKIFISDQEGRFLAMNCILLVLKLILAVEIAGKIINIYIQMRMML